MGVTKMAAPASKRPTVRFLQTWVEDTRRHAFLDACILDERRVVDTLQKFEDGTFGNCVMCGAPIEREILAEQPWAKRCGSCRQPAPIVPFRPRERAEIPRSAA